MGFIEGNPLILKKIKEHDTQIGENTSDISDLQAQIQNVTNGAPIPVSLAEEMTDTTRNYVYIGTEEGYTSGDWYYWNGSAWVSGGSYQNTELVNEIKTDLDVLSQDYQSHKNDYATYKDYNSLKIAKVEKELNNYQQTMASMNVNQEAKQTATGYGIVSLPKNAANGQVSSIGIKGRTLKNELNYNRDTWEEWTGVGTQAIMLNGYLRILPNKEAIIRLTTKYKANTKYGLLVYIAQNTRTSYVTIAMSGTYDVFLESAVIRYGLSGYVKGVLQTKEEITTNRHYIYAPANEGIIDIGDIRVFELPTGSEIEQDFETLPADQLAQKYPYIKGDSVKSTIGAMRIKSVSEDESEVSTAYVVAKDEQGKIAELRSLLNGVKDEVRVSGGKAEHIKRIDDDGVAELAEPIITPIQVSGTLLSNPSGTVYVEPVVADAGIYDEGMAVLHEDLPIKVVEKVSKVDFATGLETELDIEGIEISTDGLSFTHPELEDGDIVFFTYFYDKEGTLGETTIEYYDSRYVLKDDVTGKFYKVVPKVSNGELINDLVEV